MGQHAGLRSSGIVAPFVIDCAVDRDVFETWLSKVLVPELRAGDIVIMDNLSSHKGPRVEALIRAVGAELRYLPPYSPDFNPIENAFAKLKALLRKEAARTIDALWSAISRLVDLITPAEAINMFANAGYDPESWDSALNASFHRQRGIAALVDPHRQTPAPV